MNSNNEEIKFRYSRVNALILYPLVTEQRKANPKTNMDLHGAKLYKKESAFSSMRRGVVGDWQNYFSDEQLEKFTKLYDSRMEGTGLDFEFTE